MSLTGQLIYQLVANEVSTVDLQQLTGALNYSKSKSFIDGTGSGKIQVVYEKTRSLAGSAAETLDFSGSLVNSFGKTISFTKIKAIIVHAAPANNAGNLLVISRPANGLVLFAASGDALIGLGPDAVFIFMDPGATGVPVTGATGDLLTFTNNAAVNTISYDIIVLGEGSLA